MTYRFHIHNNNSIPYLRQQAALYNPPWDKDSLTHCIGNIQYRAEPKQVKAWMVVGEILFGTLNFAKCVFEMEGLKLTPYQCECVWLDRVDNQLIEGTWLECPTRTSYTQNGIDILDSLVGLGNQSHLSFTSVWNVTLLNGGKQHEVGITEWYV